MAAEVQAPEGFFVPEGEIYRRVNCNGGCTVVTEIHGGGPLHSPYRIDVSLDFEKGYATAEEAARAAIVMVKALTHLLARITQG